MSWTHLIPMLADAAAAAAPEVAAAPGPTRAEVVGQAVVILAQGMVSIFIFMGLFWGLIVALERGLRGRDAAPPEQGGS